MAIPVRYKGQSVGIFYADIIVGGKVILEIKTANEVTSLHKAQLLHYLRSTELEIGLVLAFGEQPLFARVFFSNNRKPNLTTIPIRPAS